MFVYSLYEQYLKEGKTFVPKLKNILSAGSSLSPLTLAQTAQLDPKTPDFWNGGLKTFENFIQELKKTI